SLAIRGVGDVEKVGVYQSRMMLNASRFRERRLLSFLERCFSPERPSTRVFQQPWDLSPAKTRRVESGYVGPTSGALGYTSFPINSYASSVEGSPMNKPTPEPASSSHARLS